MKKPDSVIKIQSSIESFFKEWLTFLKPMHHLIDSDINVLACFLKYRYELSKSINDSNILDQVLMNNDYRRKVREDCGINKAYFNVIFGKLKKMGVIVNDRINPKLIPNFNGEPFQLVVYFDVTNDRQVDLEQTTKEA